MDHFFRVNPCETFSKIKARPWNFKKKPCVIHTTEGLGTADFSPLRIAPLVCREILELKAKTLAPPFGTLP